MTTYTEDITTGNLLLSKNNLEDAIKHFEQALNKVEFDEQRIDLINSIGRLCLNSNKLEKAVLYFEKSLNEHQNLNDEKAEKLLVNKATVLNNLGALFVNTDLNKAINYHKEALGIFSNATENEPETYATHLANTHYSLAEVYYKKKDYFLAKKYFKEAVKIYESIKNNKTLEVLKGNAFYNLGNIYTDENNVYDARTNYLKAFKIFSKLTEINPKAYRPMLAATLNNLAVTAKSMYVYSDAIKYYEKSLEHYEQLLAINKEYFLPFYAATLNSLGVIYTEQHEVKDEYDSGGLSGFSGFGALSTDTLPDENKDKIDNERKEKALNYYIKAAEVYNTLTENEPETYTHYLATVLHNLAVLHDDKKDYKKAKNYYNQALTIRKFLAKKQPEAFNLDVCATLLNLVTLNQNLLETTAKMEYKTEAFSFLKEIEQRLKDYSDDKPVVLSMKSDTQYFTQYFNKIDKEHIEVLQTFTEADKLSEEIKTTIVPSEKLKFQKNILNLIYSQYLKYPENKQLQSELLTAYIDYSWFALRNKDIPIAEKALENGFKIDKNSLSLKANMAHLLLIKNEIKAAKKLYQSLKELTNNENEGFKKMLETDLLVLKNDGVLTIEKTTLEELIS